MRWLTNFYDFRFKWTATDDERCGRSKEVNTPELIGQRVRLGLLCWGFKGVQDEEIPSEEASTLQIGSVAFPVGQCTSPQLHPCHRLFDQVPHLPYSPELAPCDLWLFSKLRGCRYETIEEMKEAVTKVIDTVTQEDFLGSSRSCWNGTTSTWQLEEITSKSTSVSRVYYQ